LPNNHTLDSRYGGDESNYIIALDPRLLEEVGDLVLDVIISKYLNHKEWQ